LDHSRVVYYMRCNAMLMFRFFLCICDELSDAVGPVVRSGSRSNVGKLRVDLQGFFLPAGSTSENIVPKPGQNGTYFDEAFRLTLSLTCSTVVGFASLLPPLKPIERPTVPRRVPMARYSVLIARPRITLHSNKPMNNWPQIGEGTEDKLGHDGGC
jgi:hypothetical protein